MKRIPAQERVPLLASKWLHIQFLIDLDEMKSLLDALGPIFLYSTLGVKPFGENELTKDSFLSAYSRYVEKLKKGERLQDEEFRFYFTTVLTSTLEAIQALDVLENREIICPKLPCLQLQHHRFDYSQLDGKFRSMVLGKDTISWGLQISYPQLFQDPTTRVVTSALNVKDFENAHLFKTFQEWIRKNTEPVPFIIDNTVVRAPMRIGRNCFSWISKHPELDAKGISIKVKDGH